MPKQIIDYNNTLIYRIVCKDLTITDCYVGHTTNMIKRRQQHKADCKNINLKLYKFIRENGDWNNWEMIKIEDYPCKDRNEATKRERYWKEYYNATLNTNIPSRTKKEYCFDNKDEVKERVVKFQQYYKTILQDCKKQCPCGLSFFKGFSNTEDIGECYLKKHYGSKRHQNYIELIEKQKPDNELHLNSLSKKQLVDICKNNKIYGMTNSKKADIILEILKYNIKI